MQRIRKASVDTGRPSVATLTLWAPATYRIVVRGRLSQQCTAQLSGLCLTKLQPRDGYWVTTLTVRMMDQAALLGTLNYLSGRGLPLLLVECMSTVGPGGVGEQGADTNPGSATPVG